MGSGRGCEAGDLTGAAAELRHHDPVGQHDRARAELQRVGQVVGDHQHRHVEVEQDLGQLPTGGRIYVEAVEMPGVKTTAMWGRPVRILKIEALPKVETATQALEIALACLKEQPWADQYLPETACATQTAEGWDVDIKAVDWKSRRPSSCLIRVHKATGQAKWVPQE